MKFGCKKYTDYVLEDRYEGLNHKESVSFPDFKHSSAKCKLENSCNSLIQSDLVTQ